MIDAMMMVWLVVASALLTGGTDPVACTFSNPRYAGQCVEQVTPAEKQTPVRACQVILDCLNDARCVKTYCKSTTVRGGWKLESPKDTEREH